MKVLYSHYLSVEEHPATRMVHTIAGELRNFGHKVNVHCSVTQQPKAKANMVGTSQSPRISRLKKSLWFAKAIRQNYDQIKRDRAILEQYQPDVVLCRNDAYCYSMPKACLEKKIPLVTYTDAPAAFEARRFNSSGRWHPPMILERVEKWVLQNSSGVITVSHPSKAILERYKTGTPISVAHNGVDSTQYQPLTLEEKSTIRKREGAKRPTIVGFVGSFSAFHGIELLTGLIQLSTRRSDIEWWLIGDGPGRKHLEADLQRIPGVRFFGSLPPQQIPELLGSFDASIIPHEMMGSDFYFCPLKILESMACGVPCLASHQGDIPELLDVGIDISLMSEPDPVKWYKALINLIDSKETVERLSVANREKAVAKYSWKNTSSIVETVLNAALIGRKLDTSTAQGNRSRKAQDTVGATHATAT